MNAYEANRARVLDIAGATSGYDRVRAYMGTTRRLDFRTGQVTDYSRPARRQQDRKEAEDRPFSVPLAKALAAIEPGHGMFIQGLHLPPNSYLRYSPGFLSERRKESAANPARYQALFQVL